MRNTIPIRKPRVNLFIIHGFDLGGMEGGLGRRAVRPHKRAWTELPMDPVTSVQNPNPLPPVSGAGLVP